MRLPELQIIINDVQRSVIKPEDRPIVCKAVQEYYKEMHAIGALKNAPIIVDASSDTIDLLKKHCDGMNKEDLAKLSTILGIATDSEMTNKAIIALIKEK